MKKNDYNITVITNFKKGNRAKFTMPYKQFIKTLNADNAMRADLWVNSNTIKPYDAFYKVIGLKLDKKNGRIKEIELTAELEDNNE